MTRTIDYYFDFPSPYAYLAHTQLPRIAAEHGAQLTYHPFRILDLMKLQGQAERVFHRARGDRRRGMARSQPAPLVLVVQCRDQAVRRDLVARAWKRADADAALESVTATR